MSSHDQFDVLRVASPRVPSHLNKRNIRERVKRERRTSAALEAEAENKFRRYKEKCKQRFKDAPGTYRSFRKIWIRFIEDQRGDKIIAWTTACKGLRALIGTLAPDLFMEFLDLFPETNQRSHMPQDKSASSRVQSRMEQDDNGSSAKSQSLGHSRQLVDNVPIATRDWNYSKFQYNELLRKIQRNFPRKPSVERKFRQLMGTKSSAMELRPRVHHIFRRAPELWHDYDRMMQDIDRYRHVASSNNQPSITNRSLGLGNLGGHNLKEEDDDLDSFINPIQHNHKDRDHAVQGTGSSPQPVNETPPRFKPFTAFAPGSQFGQNFDEEEVMNALYPSDDELVRNRQSAREDVRIFLSLPDTEIAPEERIPTPDAMSCQLMEHQRCGLTWLVRQEEDDAKRGGLLADDMGLGKTIQALALILARPSEDPSRKTTLIVSPLSVVKQWESEIRNKVEPAHKFEIYLHHGLSRRGRTVRSMLAYDVVLTTYNTLVSEYKLKWGITKDHPQPQHRPLLTSRKLVLLHRDAHFHRVILDEAHTIRNRSARCSTAVADLKANYRLCLTGTPIMNGTAEFFPLIRFLNISPYNRWELFDSQIRRPLNRWLENEFEMKRIHADAMFKLQAIVKAITLRRTKSSMLDGQPILVLPKITRVKVATTFNADQAAFYSTLEGHQQIRLYKLQKSGEDTTFFIFVLLLRLRQACCHPYLTKNHGIPFGCSIGAHQMVKLALNLGPEVVDRIQAVEEFSCPICTDKTDAPVFIYPCGHYTCSSCFTGMVEMGEPVIDNGDEDQDQTHLIPKCPWPECKVRVFSDKVICFCYFQEALELGGATSTDDEETGLSLGGFVVPDDESDGTLNHEIGGDKDTVIADSDVDTGLAHSFAESDQQTASSDSEGYLGHQGPSMNAMVRRSSPGDARRGRRPRTRAFRRLKEENELDEQSDLEMAFTNSRRVPASSSRLAREQYFRTLRTEFVSSAKIDQAMLLLHEIGPDKKSLIFSQWTAFLDLLEIPISDAGYRYTRYDGSMKPQEREEAVRAFQEDPRVTIMLVSLRAGNAGLNLTAAQHVLIMEPDWNPFVEDQAIDRTHRIGQKNEVTVHRLLIAGTVEDRILELQAKKRRLVQAALNEDGASGVSSLTMEELIGLFRSGLYDDTRDE